MNTIEYIAKLKQELGITSDYALSQKLGVTRQTICNYAKGKNHFDDAVSAKVAAILGIHAGFVMLDMHRQRATTPEEANTWQEIFQGFLSLLVHGKDRRAIAR